MKFNWVLTTIFLLLLIVAKGQGTYQWKNIEKVTFYDLSSSGSDCKIYSIDKIPKSAKAVTCRTTDWKICFNKMGTIGMDLGVEACQVLVVIFKNGVKSLFLFFPRQKAIMEREKDKWGVFFFDKENYKLLDSVYKSCTDCVKDPKCK